MPRLPIKAIGITTAFGYDAESLAIPVFPGNKNGFSVRLERVPSGKIPSALLDDKTSAAAESA